jgi:hypothetical protein
MVCTKKFVNKFHFIKTIGPAKVLNTELENSPYMDFRAEDILPILRPVKSNYFCDRSYRGAFR